MTLRNKLLFSTQGAILTCFVAFYFFELFSQLGRVESILADTTSTMTELVSVAAAPFLRDGDVPGLEACVRAFVRHRDLVGVEILDASGATLARAEETDLPVLVRKEADVALGSRLGLARVAFTDRNIIAEKRDLMIELTVLMVVVFAFMFWIMYLISKRLIIRPVIRLTGIVADMAEGEGNLAVSLPVKGDDEVARLSGYFNTFVGKLRSIVVALKDVAAGSRGMGEDLARSSRGLASSSARLSDSMRHMSASTALLRDEIGGSSGQMGRINDSIERVVEMIREQAAAINESSAAVEQMIANVGAIELSTEAKLALTRDLEALAKRLEEGAAQNVEEMEEISASTDLISEMIAVINQVASQTNLLAMNAAIEAAHAGEFGKGFSVVADEIRKLAEQTGSNAKDISSSLGEIVRRIDSATVLTRESSDTIGKVISGVSEVGAGMGATLSALKEISMGNRQITDALGELNRMTEEVKASGSEMREGSVRIAASFRRITEVVEENREGVDEIARGIEEISSSMSDLKELSDHNAANMVTLDEELSKFRTD